MTSPLSSGALDQTTGITMLTVGRDGPRISEADIAVMPARALCEAYLLYDDLFRAGQWANRDAYDTASRHWILIQRHLATRLSPSLNGETR